MGILNGAQVKELFDNEAVLIGSNDGVPLFRVVELFGEPAANFANKRRSEVRPGMYSSTFGVQGEYTLPYLTYRGFMEAASYRNVELLREVREGQKNLGVSA